MATAPVLKPSIRKQLAPPNTDLFEDTTMKWTTPRIVEISVGLEINSYARAELN
jgi:coenzyme PQQ precursor peptide PqqA